MDLFTYYRSTSSYRVRIALAYKGLSYEAVPINLIKDGGEHRRLDYLALNPQGRIPLLRTDEGMLIPQSPAILEYLEERYPETPLLPKDVLARAQHRSVAAIIGCDIHPLHNVSVLNRLRQLNVGEKDVSAWIAHWISEGLRSVEALIGDEGFCFGTVGLADVYLLPQLYAARRFNVSLEPFSRLARVERLALAHTAFQQAHPDVQVDRPI
ncbi:maleylacetoacetate isomerase [Pseudomonas asuensis]|uniref:Maleylacetoacetate isomerase n=1 Tax=Pseudomonas asuensis TaxID=1825787 RepID=A0ABQ2GX16_9PSED|nr:maleylacetoacetate isomerase [Pseudomonas asuensis]GGM18012.1 maleylacetoacetate isomerase [Pseudomonas asuensis]